MGFSTVQSGYYAARMRDVNDPGRFVQITPDKDRVYIARNRAFDREPIVLSWADVRRLHAYLDEMLRENEFRMWMGDESRLDGEDEEGE